MLAGNPASPLQRCSHLHSPACLLWRREKYFPGHLEMHAACQSWRCGTAPSLTENKLCSPKSEEKKKLSWVSPGRIPEDDFGRGLCLQTDCEPLLHEGEKQKQALRCCREPREHVLSLGLSHQIVVSCSNHINWLSCLDWMAKRHNMHLFQEFSEKGIPRNVSSDVGKLFRPLVIKANHPIPNFWVSMVVWEQ